MVADHAGLVAEQLEHRLVAARLDLRAADARERRGRDDVDGRARNVRAGHFHRRQFDRFAHGRRHGGRDVRRRCAFDQERVRRDLHGVQIAALQQHVECARRRQVGLQTGRSAFADQRGRVHQLHTALRGERLQCAIEATGRNDEAHRRGRRRLRGAHRRRRAGHREGSGNGEGESELPGHWRLREST
ncbi:hypothetical protein ACFW0P_03440 [Lysobacter soli]|uniref:hypothetical protein n=1 Tax=Lysobacter soli TaxID=453783 RepID=UPI0036A1A327